MFNDQKGEAKGKKKEKWATLIIKFKEASSPVHVRENKFCLKTK